jgi:TolB-like protein
MSVEHFEFGPFVLDAAAGTLTRDGRPVAVGNRGMALLIELLRAKHQPVSKAVLMDAAWPGLTVEESNLSVQVAALRKLLGPTPTGGEWIKTIPRVGYRLVSGSGSEEPRTSVRDSQTDRVARPSIAMLPIANISGHQEQDYLAYGITEDIITALARFRWFSVVAVKSSLAHRSNPGEAMQIAAELGVRYFLQGSLRRSGQRVRLSAQLIEAATGVHIWAERYDLELTEVFAVQDDIAERVAGAIEPALLKTEAALAASRHTGNMTAWDLVRQGTWRFHQVTRPTHFQARDLFRQACQLDPQLPEAQIWLARVNAGILAYNWSDNTAADREEGLKAAFAGIHLDDKNPYSHYGLAIISVYGRELEQAVRAAQKAVELSHSFALGHLVLGMARLFSGAPAEAIAPLERGLQLNAFDPQNFVWFNLLSLARLFAGQYESARDAAERAVSVRPDWRPSLETLACCYIELDRNEEAHRCVEQLRQLSGSSGDALAPLRERNYHWADRINAMLRKAAQNR